jgi:hypothetical protein
MYIHEEMVMRMAEERIREAQRAAEQERMVRRAGSPTSARVRLGRSLVLLGHWISGETSPVVS